MLSVSRAQKGSKGAENASKQGVMPENRRFTGFIENLLII